MALFKVEFEAKEELTEKQTTAVMLRASGLSWEEVAEHMDISARQLRRYKESPSVKAAVRAATDAVWEQVKITLVKESLTAAKTLASLLDDQDVSPGHKISASRTLLEQAVRAQTNEDLAMRLQELEARLNKPSEEAASQVDYDELINKAQQELERP